MGVTAIGGLVLILLAVVVSTVLDGNSFGPLISPSSFVLVFFATVGASAFAYELQDIANLPKVVVRAMKSSSYDLSDRISMYMRLAESARREGLLALDSQLDDIDDAYVQYGLRLVTDGADETQLKEELDAYMGAIEERHAVPSAIFRKLASYAPGFGMVGTVIGLVNMLGNLSSPEELGAGMALALLTTLYGVVFANVVFQPLAERLEKLHAAEMSAMEFDTDAICALQSGTSPRALVAHLESLLPPGQRQGYDDRLQAAA
jgi:chemotaxis protein MotA